MPHSGTIPLIVFSISIWIFFGISIYQLFAYSLIRLFQLFQALVACRDFYRPDTHNKTSAVGIQTHKASE